MKLGSRRRRSGISGSDPIGERIRSLRIARGLSLQKLGERARAAPSHIFHIENGDKTPSEALAARIARTLGEDVQIFRAWARLRRRSSLGVALEAAPVLARYLGREPAADRGVELPGGWSAPATATLAEAPASHPARLLVPLLSDGADPGEGPRPSGATGMLRLTGRDLGAVVDLEHPFSYPAVGASLRRVPDLHAEGRVLVLTRRVLPLAPGDVCAVRLDGRIELARVIWNERELLLLPAPAANDFVVLPATDADALARLIVGRVVLSHSHAAAR